MNLSKFLFFIDMERYQVAESRGGQSREQSVDQGVEGAREEPREYARQKGAGAREQMREQGGSTHLQMLILDSESEWRPAEYVCTVNIQIMALCRQQSSYGRDVTNFNSS